MARWLQFAAAMFLFGVPAFGVYAMTPATLEAERSSLSGGARVAVIVATIGAGLLLLFESAEMSGDVTSIVDAGVIWSVLSGTYFGAVWSVRLALLVGVATVIGLKRPNVPLLAVLGMLFAAALAWQGHGGEGEGDLGLTHRIADVAHLIAASLWIGALVALFHLLSNALGDAERVMAALHGLSRFSGIGALVVAVLILSGILNAWPMIAPRPLAEAAATPYALVLGVKLVLFVGMLAFAALNRFVLTPRLNQAVVQTVDIAGAVAAAKRSVAIETGLAAFVLAAVAVIGVLEPPSSG